MPLPNVDWLVGWIESEVAGGRRFLPEQIAQIGWSVLEIRERTDATLGLFEPDFQSMPVKFVDSVTNTLLHLLLQKSSAESLGLSATLTIPSLRDSAIVCNRFGSSEGFIMSRVIPNAGDSGWFFGCNNPDHPHNSLETLRRVSLYEAVVGHEARIVPFLGLPPDTFVGFDDDVPCFALGKTELKIQPGSYLHQKYVTKNC